ncbi:MAG: protoporphyrinogen oxidase HemJ [Rhizobiales bacterium]|nr:protoporphyrinogen oxidase HemJ [Hyphomicrobiales bacterium]
MSDLIVAWYPWIKALHVIAVVAWMAGLLYLPRLFVYHCSAQPGSELSETLKAMERRLLRAIMNPAMGAVWIFGLALLWVQDWSQGWLHGKLALVVALTWLHHRMARWRKDFAADRNTRPAKFYRIANEIPTLLLIAIVILVIVKPF